MISEEFISSIHNYCDRWCAHCEFTARCSVFAKGSEMAEDDNDIANRAFAPDLQSTFSDAAEVMPPEIPEANELDANPDPPGFEEYLKMAEMKDELVESNDLARLAEEYSFGIGLVLDEAQKDWFKTSDIDDETMQEVLGVISWYQYFISAKVRRGLHGILNDEGDEDAAAVHDSQSDANGSIKIALIAIERSILAWTHILNDNNLEVVRPIIETLESIKQTAEQKFPLANDFVRPGFDELETVM